MKIHPDLTNDQVIDGLIHKLDKERGETRYKRERVTRMLRQALDVVEDTSHEEHGDFSRKLIVERLEDVLALL